MALRSTLTPSFPVAHQTQKVAEQSTQGDRGWAVRGGSTTARAFQRPHRAHRRTNSPTKCESSTNTSNATDTGAQTLVAATIEMSSMRARWWIGHRTRHIGSKRWRSRFAFGSRSSSRIVAERSSSSRATADPRFRPCFFLPPIVLAGRLTSANDADERHRTDRLQVQR